ncbi:MAG: ABC transporter ATP-binding protein [Pelosinus sp.]|nr:ABC transporter ATP-binding protein [Pelosinus sp.]
MSCIVSGKNLVKYYDDFKALKGISFGINEGECFGFLGHNGAGKSTTMRMIYGLSAVGEGELWVMGERISLLTPPAIKAQLGVVPQEDNLDDELTVIENLEVYGGYFGLKRKEAHRRGLELLEFMSLKDKEHEYVTALSGGLKRRLVIARALINRPRIIILDEPTTGLDPQARRLVWQKLRQLKNEGATLVLTTHYMEEAVQLCDRLVIMNEGLVLAEGSPDELVKKYVLPYVIEVHMPPVEIPETFFEKVQAFGAEIVNRAEGLFLYSASGRELWGKLDELGLPPHVCYLRPAHLEDVYLSLTGHGGTA